MAAQQLVSGGRWHRADGPALNTALSCCSVVQAARQGGGPEVPECSAAVGSGSWTPQCPQKLPLLPAPPALLPCCEEEQGEALPTSWGQNSLGQGGQVCRHCCMGSSAGGLCAGCVGGQQDMRGDQVRACTGSSAGSCVGDVNCSVPQGVCLVKAAPKRGTCGGLLTPATETVECLLLLSHCH